MSQKLNVRKVAVTGAGVSGVSTAIYLKRAGLDVTVYERNSRAGGVWVYDERTAHSPMFPSILPSTGDSPEFDARDHQSEAQDRHDSPLSTPTPEKSAELSREDILRSFAPPGPAYDVLRNNVSTIEMELPFQKWKAGTEEIVPHHVLAEYIQDTARASGIQDLISFNSRVQHIEKVGDQWQADVVRLENAWDRVSFTQSKEYFDAVVVASGHYHHSNVPNIAGLARWKQKVSGQGTTFQALPGVSSMDIARDLGDHARAVYQSSRGGPYDLPAHMLPEIGFRIGGVDSFDEPLADELAPDNSIPAQVTLTYGDKLCNIHSVIVCTGYHVSLPFAKQYHADGVRPDDADEQVIVTDGIMTHNLHKDIWHIQDPTLAFIGVPYHVATFSLFAFQGAALAEVFAGKAELPSTADMRQEYNDRICRRGIGRAFHSLKEHLC